MQNKVKADLGGIVAFPLLLEYKLRQDGDSCGKGIAVASAANPRARTPRNTAGCAPSHSTSYGFKHRPCTEWYIFANFECYVHVINTICLKRKENLRSLALYILISGYLN